MGDKNEKNGKLKYVIAVGLGLAKRYSANNF
jgi:hypothetical protein